MSWAGEFVINVHNWFHGVTKVKSTLSKNESPLRIGIISAAAVNFSAIIDPVQAHPDVVVTAIAARSKARAEAQIVRYQVTDCKAYGSYDEIIADPTIEALYIPLPNGLHGQWAIKAMEAGKHVLVEKPIASSVAEARQLQDTARRTGRVILEAFHWCFHPAAHTVKALVESGKYGHVTAINTRMSVPSGILGKDVTFTGFAAPWITHSITISEKDTGTKISMDKIFTGGPQWKNDRGERWWTTYRYILEAFVEKVRAKDQGNENAYQGPWVNMEESIQVMDIIDSVYEKAGLPKRGEESRA